MASLTSLLQLRADDDAQYHEGLAHHHALLNEALQSREVHAAVVEMRIEPLHDDVVDVCIEYAHSNAQEDSYCLRLPVLRARADCDEVLTHCIALARDEIKMNLRDMTRARQSLRRYREVDVEDACVTYSDNTATAWIKEGYTGHCHKFDFDLTALRAYQRVVSNWASAPIILDGMRRIRDAIRDKRACSTTSKRRREQG